MINNFFNNGGTLPGAFVPVFALSGGSLTNALSQLSGEAATGAERAAISADERISRTDARPVRQRARQCRRRRRRRRIGFAPDAASEPAARYRARLRLDPHQGTAQAGVRAALDRVGLGVWRQQHGERQCCRSAQTTSRQAPSASRGGMDYHLSPSTVVGFALAGAGTNWGLANALGTGRSDAFQVGGYGISWLGPAYVAGALAFSNHWFTTSRSAPGDALTANFVGQSYGARLESGYRYAVLPTLGVTPYGALQVARLSHAGLQRESDMTGGGFGLSYAR